MPTYGYRCQDCGCDFDVWQKMTDDPVASCPTCGGAGKRQFFPAGIVFKGSGFYATDSRKASTASSGSNGSAKPSSDKAGDTSTSSPKADSGSGSTASGSSTPATSSD